MKSSIELSSEHYTQKKTPFVLFILLLHYEIFIAHHFCFGLKKIIFVVAVVFVRHSYYSDSIEFIRANVSMFIQLNLLSFEKKYKKT